MATAEVVAWSSRESRNRFNYGTGNDAVQGSHLATHTINERLKMNKQEASVALDKKLGIAESDYYTDNQFITHAPHLYQDKTRLDALCIEHGLGTAFDLNGETVITSKDSIFKEIYFALREDFTDHPTKQDAVACARFKALCKLYGIDYGTS